jgi:hypothetical protein
MVKVELLNHDLVGIVFDAVRTALNTAHQQNAYQPIVTKLLANRRASP